MSVVWGRFGLRKIDFILLLACRTKETLNLRQQIDTLNAAIAKEEEKANALEDKCTVFASGFGDADAQDKLLDELNTRVKEAYRKCFNEHDSSISTLQMLTSLENKLEHLFEVIEMMPADKVEQAEKVGRCGGWHQCSKDMSERLAHVSHTIAQGPRASSSLTRAKTGGTAHSPGGTGTKGTGTRTGSCQEEDGKTCGVSVATTAASCENQECREEKG